MCKRGQISFDALEPLGDRLGLGEEHLSFAGRGAGDRLGFVVALSAKVLGLSDEHTTLALDVEQTVEVELETLFLSPGFDEVGKRTDERDVKLRGTILQTAA